MKQWRKLTGVGVSKEKQHPSGSSQPPPNGLQGLPGNSTSGIGDETAEPDQDDSIEDEFRRGMKVRSFYQFVWV